MFRKKFSKDLHEQNDIRAREKVKEILKNTSLEVRDNPDRYKTDLVIYENGLYVCHFELEVKQVWKGKDFPYDDVQFLARKKHQAGENTVFIMFNNDLSSHLAIRGNKLNQVHKTRKITNKFSEGNLEDFMVVDKKDVKFDWLYRIAQKKKINN